MNYELTKSVVHIGPLDLKLDGQKGLTWYVKPIIFCPSLDEPAEHLRDDITCDMG